MNDGIPAMGIKLSIAIPTYNGAQTIRETLDSIVSQLEECVEIVVSDNASTDSTADIVREYQARYPVIRYFCNDENFGVDRNFDLAVQRAAGKYVWFFGDDDKMCCGGIKKVLDVLNADIEIANIFVNCQMMSSDMELCFKERVINIDQDLILNQDDFLLQVGATAALVPSIIVLRSLWLKVEKTKFSNTHWLVLAAIYSMLQGHYAYCISKPYVLFRDGSSRWHKEGRYFHMVLDLCKIMQGFVQYGYDKVTVSKAIKMLTKNPTLLIYSSKQNGLTISFWLIIEACKRFGRSPIFWLIGLPLLLLPKACIQLIWEIYQVPFIRYIYKWGKSHIRKIA
jgi:glycosyltransferase involved in cell wall biosynthesis